MPAGSAPLLYAATTGSTPFRFNLHVEDLGHTLMIGPPGAGKSTFLGRVAAQWFRYPRAQVFATEKKTFIQMTPNVAHREAPVLVVLGPDGVEMVNCTPDSTLALLRFDTRGTSAYATEIGIASVNLEYRRLVQTSVAKLARTIRR